MERRIHLTLKEARVRVVSLHSRIVCHENLIHKAVLMGIFPT
jgi:hypothetical protein